MKIEPYIVLGASQRNEINESLRLDAEQWWAEWLPQGMSSPAWMSQIKVSEWTVSEHQEHDIQVSDADTGAQYSVGPQSISRLGSYLTLGQYELSGASAENSPVLQDLVRRALHSLTTLWIPSAKFSVLEEQHSESQELTSTAEFAVPSHLVYGLQITIAEAEVYFALPIKYLYSKLNTDVATPDNERKSLIPRDAALSNQSVRLIAMLGELELTLESLSTLQPGDVVRLEKPISAPLCMHLENSTDGFSGFLGKQEDNLAFKVNSVLTPENVDFTNPINRRAPT